MLQPVRPDMPRIADAYYDQVLSRLRVLRRDPILKPQAPPAGSAGSANQTAHRAP